MRHPCSTPALVAGALVALAVASALQPSPAAADACLTAPNGAAAKGQHWYYHLDRATKRKCWYLRDAGGDAAATAAPAEAASASADAPAATAAPPAPAPAINAPPTAAPVTATAAPVAAMPQNDATVWAETPAASAGDVRETDAAPEPAAAPAAVSPSAPPAEQAPPAPRRDAAAVRDADAPAATAQFAAAEPQESRGSLAENMLVIGLAAGLAAGVFALVALIYRRKQTAAAAEAALVPPAAPAAPRFGSGPRRRSPARWHANMAASDDEVPLLPIEASLIPEQVPMPLPPVDFRR